MSKVLELCERIEKEYQMAPVCSQVQSEVYTLTKIIRLQHKVLGDLEALAPVTISALFLETNRIAGGE